MREGHWSNRGRDHFDDEQPHDYEDFGEKKAYGGKPWVDYTGDDKSSVGKLKCASCGKLMKAEDQYVNLGGIGSAPVCRNCAVRDGEGDYPTPTQRPKSPPSDGAGISTGTIWTKNKDNRLVRRT